MPSIRKILVPVDYSAASMDALEYAIFLAEKVDGQVMVLHTWELPPHTGPEVMVSTDVGPESLPDFVQHRAEHTLREFLAPYVRGRGVRIEGRLVNGVPSRTIPEVAKEENADMIVMGTHGRTGLSRLFLGSVAEQVIRHAHCPVVTLRSDDSQATAAAEPQAEPPHPPGEAAPPYLRPHVYGYRDAIASGVIDQDKYKGSLW